MFFYKMLKFGDSYLFCVFILQMFKEYLNLYAFNILIKLRLISFQLHYIDININCIKDVKAIKHKRGDLSYFIFQKFYLKS
jgi:hypothetical protein